jgi:hypothetical protein
MNKALVLECKSFINEGNLIGLQEYYSNIQNADFGYDPNWQYIYSQIYLHACLKKKQEIADWLVEIFLIFDPVSQIALRQIFPYGRYLLAK